MRDLFLSIDVGTGSIRAALLDRTGRILALGTRAHEQIVPRFGWAEQRASDWWDGTIGAIRDVLARVEGGPARVAAICACGQMHGTVLVDDDGRPTRDAILLWNDKRPQGEVDAFAARPDAAAAAARAANAPSPAWPAFKLQWLSQNAPEAFAAARTVLMPKDWINFRLTGLRAQDPTEASLSFLTDWRENGWSAPLLAATGLPAALLPPIRPAGSILGPLSAEAGALLGLSPGIPVLVGAGDFPMALLGSGVMQPGFASDVTGTSSLLTLVRAEPRIVSEISNLRLVAGGWGAFVMVDAGGDSVRWARRAFHANALTHDEIEAAAAEAPPGAQHLFFLPWLSGERTGPDRNARAQFFGLTASHGLPHLHRAVLEGVAFAMRQKLDALQGGNGRPERIVAAGGGAKSALWLRIKAAMFRTPYLLPQEPECGLVGAAILMAHATGAAADLAAASAAMVRHDRDILPDPAAADLYDRMTPVFAGLGEAARTFHAALDRL